MELDRRELFRIITTTLAAAPALAQHQHAAPPAALPDFAAYTPRALSPAQYRALDALCEILLPAGDDGPGAHDAGVAYYLDTVLHYGSDAQRASWRRGLDAAAASASPLEAVIAQWAKNEAAPRTADEQFFVAFKRAAIDAFYLSAQGRRCLGYQGDTALPSFPGCTHKEHQA